MHALRASRPTRRCPCRRLQGTSGNAVQYVTRNQALKKLQLKLSEFRRLCILKGIHPREPKKKPQVPIGCVPAPGSGACSWFMAAIASCRLTATLAWLVASPRVTQPSPASWQQVGLALLAATLPHRNSGPTSCDIAMLPLLCAGPEQDVLPRQGHCLPAARAAAEEGARAARVREEGGREGVVEGPLELASQQQAGRVTGIIV